MQELIDESSNFFLFQIRRWNIIQKPKMFGSRVVLYVFHRVSRDDTNRKIFNYMVVLIPFGALDTEEFLEICVEFLDM
jgi:hypothetical protein